MKESKHKKALELAKDMKKEVNVLKCRECGEKHKTSEHKNK